MDKSKYSPVTVHEYCPHCKRLLRFTALASWTDFLPTHFCCPHCGTVLEFSGEGGLVICFE